MTPITDADIEALRVEAELHEDIEVANLCRAALSGGQTSRRFVEAIIFDTRRQKEAAP